MDEKKIEKRKEYMKNYYLKNKERYKNGHYIKKKEEKPIFKIIRKPIIITFE